MATSYYNPGGKGNRSAIITMSATSGLFHANSFSYLIDGGVTAHDYFDAQTASGKYARFDFGERKLIDEALWKQNTTQSHGTWKWQGSDDKAGWTDVGSSFTLGGVQNQTQTSLNGNTVGYRYWQLIGVSGNTSGGPYLIEIEFKIDIYVVSDILTLPLLALSV